ncbi:MAG TPA: SRPBCC family protein [Solirubrobacterales bacterium]
MSAAVEIDVPRSEAFAELCDLSRRPSFTDHFISDLRLTRIDPVGLGAGARFRFETPPRHLWMDTTITEVSAPQRIVEHGRGGRTNRIPSTTVWELLEGPGSLITARVSFWTEPANHVDRAIDSLGMASIWLERGWREAMNRLRDNLEAGTGPAGAVSVAGGNPHATGIP